MAGGDGAARVRVQRHRFDRADPSSPGSLWACRVVSGAFGRQGVDVRAGASGSDAHVGNGFRDGSRTPGVLPAAWHAGNQACPAAGASERLLPQVTPQPEISFISEDLPFRMGSRIWVPVQTAGHAPASVVLPCRQRRSAMRRCRAAANLAQREPAARQRCRAAGTIPRRLRRLRELHVRTAYPDTATRSRISVNGSTRPPPSRGAPGDHRRHAERCRSPNRLRGLHRPLRRSSASTSSASPCAKRWPISPS